MKDDVKVKMVVAGLKCDSGARGVSFQDGEMMAEAYGAPYIECSAKLDINIEAVFDLVLTEIFKSERKKRKHKTIMKSIISEENAER